MEPHGNSGRVERLDDVVNSFKQKQTSRAALQAEIQTLKLKGNKMENEMDALKTKNKEMTTKLQEFQTKRIQLDEALALKTKELQERDNEKTKAFLEVHECEHRLRRLKSCIEHEKRKIFEKTAEDITNYITLRNKLTSK